MVQHERAWFVQAENKSTRIVARQILDANNVRPANGGQISINVWIITFMLAANTACFVLQWHLALIAIFLVAVAVKIVEAEFMRNKNLLSALRVVNGQQLLKNRFFSALRKRQILRRWY